MIQVQALNKKIGKIDVLSNLSFQVPKGSISGFLGPNGAGKTTTIKLLLGLLVPDSGSIRLLGEEIGRAPSVALRSKISYLPQDPVFPDQLSGREVLALVAENYSLPSAHRRAAELLAQFQLEGDASRKVSSYSRGMKQKLGLVAALLPQPQLLLLDEPVSALDPAGRHQVLALVAQLAGKATVFLSSHILADIQRVAKRVIIINKGRKLVEENLEVLLSCHRQEYYRLQVAAQSQKRAELVLKKDRAVAELVSQEKGFLVRVNPGQLGHFRSITLSSLLDAGVELLDFTQKDPDLEEIFFKILEEGERNAKSNSLGN